MRCYSNIYSLLTIILFILPRLKAQDIKFDHLTVEDGLSSPYVKCILQDQRGFIWFGTDDGLNKYDGYSFTVYRNDSQDSLSINNGDIRTLYEDPTGILWIGTGGGGVNRFDPETEIFINAYGAQPDSFFTYCSYVQQVKGFQYSNGFFLWAGTCMALVKFDISKGTLVRFPPTEDDKWSWTFDFVEAMALGPSGSVWIGCPDGGLHHFNPITNKYEHFLHDSTEPNSLCNNTINALLTDHNGNLWIGTETGLDYFNPLTRKFTHFYHNPNDINTLSSNEVISLFEDKSGVLWVGRDQRPETTKGSL